MSTPSNSTLHSQVPALDLESILAAPLTGADDALEARELEAKCLLPPKTADDTFAVGAGRMKHDDRYPDDPNKGIQLPHTVRAGILTLHQLYEMILRGRKICGKFDAPCIYAAVPVRRGCCKKINHAYAQLVPVDLDETIKDEKGLERLRRFCRLYACILYSSARHNPKAGIYRLRILFPVNASLSLEEYRRVSKAVCLQLAAYLGTADGIDSCTEKAFQPQLIPGWADESFQEQAICELFAGDVMDVTVPLVAARVEIMEKEAEEAANHCAVASSPRRALPLSSASTAGALSGVEADGIDGLAGARADLDDLGAITAGCGRSNKDLFKAATILRDWGVDLGDAIDEMSSRYSDQDGAWLAAKTRSAYEQGVGSARTGWRRRAKAAETALTFEGEFELESGAVPATPPLSVPPGRFDAHGGTRDPKKSPCASGNEPGIAQVRRTRREIHTARLPDLLSFDLLPARVTGIWSATGTAKNVHLRPAVAELLQRDGRIVSLAHRRSLTRNQSRGWNLPCYLDTKGVVVGSTSVCLDSVSRVAGGPIDVVILDEVEQMLRHLFGATIRKRGQVGVVFCALRDLLRRAKKIVLLDADLSPRAMWCIRVLMGENVDEQVIKNTWKPDRRIRVRSQAGMFADLMAKVEKGEQVWLYCTSKEGAKTYAKRIRGLFPGIQLLLVCSETTGKAEAQAALENPHLFGNYQVVIATPSVGTGVSVEHEALWHVFGDCQSGCGSVAGDAKQGLCRVRDPLSITIAMHGPRRYEATNPEFVRADLLTLSERTIRRLRGQQWSAKYLHGLTTTWIPDGEFEPRRENGQNLPIPEIKDYDKDIIRIQAEVAADAARQGNYLHDIDIKDKDGAVIETLEGALRTHLRDCGYQLFDIPDELALDVESDKKERKQAKEEVKSDWVDAVFTAPDLTDEEAKTLEEAGASTPEDVARLARWKIQRFYGERNPDRELIKRDDQGRRRKHMATVGQLLADQRGEGQANDRLDRLDARAGVSAQLDHRGKRAQVAAGLWRLFGVIDLEADGKAGTVLKDPGAALAADETLVREVRRYLKISIKKGTSTIILARALAAQSGIKLESRPGQRDQAGKQGRTYTLERDSVSLMVEDSRAYLDRLTDPARTRELLLELEAYHKQQAEQVQAILAD